MSAARVDDTTQIDLSGHLSVYRDTTGHASIEKIAESSADLFKPIKGSLSEGFTSDVVWVTFTLIKKEELQPITRWLELKEPLLFNSVLYEKKDQGKYVKVPGLLNQRIKENRKEYKKSIFEIELIDNQPKTFYLRINSQSSISSRLILWDPGQFVAINTAYRFFWGSAYGAYLIVIVLYFGFWLWSRDSTHLKYSAYILILLLASFYTDAWPQQFFPDLSSVWFFRILGILICLTLPAAMIFSFSFLKFQDKWQFYSRIIILFTFVFSSIAICLVLTDNFRIAMPLIQTCAVTAIALTWIAAFKNSKNNSRMAKLFLISFGFFYVGILLRVLRNFGIIPSNDFSENSYQIGIFIHMLIMSGAIYSIYTDMREVARESAIKLNTEIKLRKEQNEFITLLSHEFRTPLSIISSSAENILRSSNLNQEIRYRVEKIFKANHRMSEMMKSHLVNERLLDDLLLLNTEILDLNKTVADSLQDYQDLVHPVKFEPWPTSIFVLAETGMIDMIICNLLGNAVRYSPDGSVTVSCHVHGAWGEISVLDDGDGIPEKDLPHVFKKHYRGSNASGTSGTGLGLYLIQSIIEKLNGQVFARNHPTGGCEFIVRLPLVSHNEH